MILLDTLKGVPEAIARDHNKIKKALETLREIGLDSAVLEYAGQKFPVSRPSLWEALDRAFEI